MTYIVIDTRTEQAVSRPYSTRAKAQAKADQLDNRFGAYRYAVQAREGGAVTSTEMAAQA